MFEITPLDYFCITIAYMSSEADKRNNELTKKTNENAPKMQDGDSSFNTNQDMNRSVEDAEENLEDTQNNQREAAEGNNPKSKTGPAENLRSKAAQAEDKSEDSSEPA